MTNTVTLYPPLIDNTSAAFIRTLDDECTVVFYYQGDETLYKKQVGIEVFLRKENSSDYIGSFYFIKTAIREHETLFAATAGQRNKYKINLKASDIKNLLNEKDTGYVDNNNDFYSKISLEIKLCSIYKDTEVQESYQNSLAIQQAIQEWQEKGEASSWGVSNIKNSISPLEFKLYNDQTLINPSSVINPLAPFVLRGRLVSDEDEEILNWFSIVLTDEEGNILEETDGRQYPIRYETYSVTEIVIKSEEEETLSSEDQSTEIEEEKEVVFSGDQGFEYEFFYNFINLLSTVTGSDGITYLNDAQNVVITPKVTLSVYYSTVSGYTGMVTETLGIDDNSTLSEDIEVINFENEVIEDSGVVKLSFQLQTKTGLKESLSIPDTEGYYVIQRKESFFSFWETIFERQQEFVSGSEYKITVDDATAEIGKKYEYRCYYTYSLTSLSNDQTSLITNYYRTNIATTAKAPDILISDDIFLVTKDIIFKVVFNPEITSYKRNLQDIVTPTLGGRYPFVRRNGHQSYRTFNLNGLLSWEQGDQSIFFGNPIADELESKMTTYKYLDDNTQNVIKERLYREKAMSFLEDDAVLLFKSLTEGNIFIRLTNLTYTPLKQLGRLLYSFSAQATEVATANAENYMLYFSDRRPKQEDMLKDELYIKSILTKEKTEEAIKGEYAPEEGAGKFEAGTVIVSPSDIQTNDNGTTLTVYKTTAVYR